MSAGEPDGAAKLLDNGLTVLLRGPFPRPAESELRWGESYEASFPRLTDERNDALVDYIAARPELSGRHAAGSANPASPRKSLWFEAGCLEVMEQLLGAPDLAAAMGWEGGARRDGAAPEAGVRAPWMNPLPERKMECPRCRTSIPPGGTYCPLCNEPWPPKAAKASNPLLALPAATARMGWWVISGPLLIDKDGLYLFIRESAWRPPALWQLFGHVFERVSGALGGLLFKKTMSLLEDKDSPPPGALPRADFAAVYDRAVAQTPDILSCGFCLPLRRCALSGATFHGGGLLALKASGQDIELSGDFADRQAAAFMTLRGYTVARAGLSGWKKAAILLFAAVSLAGFGLDHLEMIHLSKSVASWAKPRTERVRKALDGDVRMVYVVDGKTYYQMDQKMVPAASLPWWVKAWHQGKWLIIFGLCAVAIFFMAIVIGRSRPFE